MTSLRDKAPERLLRGYKQNVLQAGTIYFTNIPSGLACQECVQKIRIVIGQILINPCGMTAVVVVGGAL